MGIDFSLPACTEELLFATVADDGLPVRHRAGFGGRGSTKSHSFARRLLLRGYERPERILAAREIQRSIEGSVKALLDDLIPLMGFGPTNGDGFYLSQKYEITGRNGTTVNFSGLRSNIASIASMEGITIAYVNEARTVSQNSINVLTPTIRAQASPGRPAGECWWDWNPALATDPVDAMFRGGEPPPGSIVRELNYPDNPWFGDPLKTEMEWVKRRDPDKYEHVWLGGYQKNSEARVFRNWRVEEFETPADAILRFGADWGFAVDPTVLIRMFIGRWENGKAIADPGGRCLFIDHEAYKIGCEIDETPALFAGNCPPDKRGSDDRPLWTNPHNHPGVPGATKWLITADSSRPETVSYMKRKSFKIAPAIKGPGSVEDGVEFLKTFDIIVHTRCTHTQDELTSYSWKTDPLTGEILPVLADKDNHLIDAGRYACEGARRARRPAAPPASEKPTDSDYRRPSASRGGDAWKS